MNPSALYLIIADEPASETNKAYSVGGHWPSVCDSKHIPGIVNGETSKNRPLVQGIALSQIAFCGRAMRAPTLRCAVLRHRH